MSTIRSSVSFLVLFFFLGLLGIEAAPAPQGNGQQLTPQQQVDQIAQGVSQATDGSTILDTTANVKYVLVFRGRERKGGLYTYLSYIHTGT